MSSATVMLKAESAGTSKCWPATWPLAVSLPSGFTEQAPAITILPSGMMEGMDKDRNQVISIEEFVAYRTAQFDPVD